MDLAAKNGIGGFWNFTDYGASTGFGTALNVKFAVYTAKKIQLRNYVTFGYSQFVNDEASAYITPGGTVNGQANPPYPYGSGTPIKTSGVSNMRLNMPSLALGIELGVYTDMRNRSSFNFGFDYLFTVITGRYYQTINGSQETFTTLRSNLRNGVGLNASYSLKFSEVVGFHVGTRFVLPNLIGKSAEMTDGDAYAYILDKANTTLNPNLSSNRTMAYFKFFGGLSIFIGKM
ncbi:MAG: hypothetical protein WCK13_03820 [Ignavibacteriota bacterium]